MNNLVNQLEQYNIFLNLDNLTFAQILEKGKWLTTILDLDNKITKPVLFYTYKILFLLIMLIYGMMIISNI